MERGSGVAKSPFGDSTHDWKATRRRVLGAGGAVALAGLAGCTALDGLLDSAGDQLVRRRTASPAAFYAGSETLDTSGALYRSGPVDVRFIPPALQAEGQRIEIDGWSTSTTTKAQDYNSSRSNKPSTIWVPDPLDDDSDGDGILDLAAALDTERALVVYADAALAAVDEQAGDEATATLDAFINATTTARQRLERCGTDRCRTVSGNLATQQELASDASVAVAAGEWDRASQSLRQARRIAQEEVERLSNPIYDDDGNEGSNPLYEGRAALNDYLDGEATIGEYFVVCLPDARVRGDGPALVEELTPERVLEYFVGDNGSEQGVDTGGPAAVHQDLSRRDLLTARLEEQARKSRHVAAFETSGGVVVTGATPDAPDAAPMLWITPDNAVSSDDALDSWGEEVTSNGVTVSSALVCPAVATPDDGEAMPALFHVRRIRHEKQLLYVGGWTIDDGALYENSATLLTADGPNFVVGVTREDIEEGGARIEYQDGDDMYVRKKPGRTTYANVTLSTPYDPDAEHLPAGAHPVCRSGGDLYCWGVQSREALARRETGGCPGNDGDSPAWSVATALDAPVLHLVDAADASNDVKFKAGAELSKAVN